MSQVPACFHETSGPLRFPPEENLSYVRVLSVGMRQLPAQQTVQESRRKAYPQAPRKRCDLNSRACFGPQRTAVCEEWGRPRGSLNAPGGVPSFLVAPRIRVVFSGFDIEFVTVFFCRLAFLIGVLYEVRDACAASLAFTSARMNSGVDPQQAPTKDAPASRSGAKWEAKNSAEVE